MSDIRHLVCPIRGVLKSTGKSRDGLSQQEEYYRVEAIKYLISKGYPKENFLIEPIVKKFGNSGRNSFRSDFAVLKHPVSEYINFDPDEIMKEVILLCEVKRDNANNQYVKETQVRPMLDFAKDVNVIGLYWDNLEHRVFWLEFNGGIRETKDGPLSFLPEYGRKIETVPLTYNTLKTPESLIDIFTRIEDLLHQASFSPEVRYEIILQMLLTKIFDEHEFETRGDIPLGLQDYESIGVSPELALKKYSSLLERTVKFYEKHLPNPISHNPRISGDLLIEVMKVLAPVRIIDAKVDVIQSFYMKFAKSMYKWDMAQYFTPTSVTEFIVNVVNPQFGEHIADPACGSADFLVAAFRVGRKTNPGFADGVWGVDNSSNAVQVAVLNMVLNGDGKSNIKCDDTLEHIDNYSSKYDIVLCNPPFGSDICEHRSSVLRQFELAQKPEGSGKDVVLSKSLYESQEMGILFIEACVRQCRPGGRMAIILPNGYLGNRSPKFTVVRKWILCNTRIAAIVSLPRFTFKSSGADVSASILFLEKLESPVQNPMDIENYFTSIEMIEKLGWSAGDKKAKPIYLRHENDGSLVLDSNNKPIVDSDFNKVLDSISRSEAAEYFTWMQRDNVDVSQFGWAVNIAKIIQDSDYTMDPKRYCLKYQTLIQRLKNNRYVRLGDLVDFIPQMRNSSMSKVKIDKSESYRYVEIANMGYGDYYYNILKGWQLPSRAKHLAEAGDIYFGSVWGSVNKWCYIASVDGNPIVTNGCFRVRLKDGMSEYLPDLLSYMSTEGWGVQLRAMARGSDGLAEVCEDDAKNVIIPVLSDDARMKLKSNIDLITDGRTTLGAAVKELINTSEVEYFEPDLRPSHINLV